MRIQFVAGLNEQQFPALEEAAVGSQNFDLARSQIQYIPRRSFDTQGTAPNHSNVNGILQLVKRDNSETTLVQAGKDVYQWDGSTTFTVKGSVAANSTLRDVYWSLDDWLIITDIQKASPVQRWTGSVFGTLPTGLAGALSAKYGTVYQNRVWLGNVTIGASVSPHVVLVSAFENATSYNSAKRAGDSTFSTGEEAFFLVSPDLKPINGMAVFFGALIISTVNGRLYRLTGTDSMDFAFQDFYPRSNAAGDESMINTGNDLVYMREGGQIESLLATMNYGDVSADDLSRWLPVTAEGLTGALAVYDQQNQKVLFFVSGRVLVMFKDFLPTKLSPWSVYRTQHSDNFNTSAAKYLKRPGTQEYSIYFGGSNGEIFDLNGTDDAGDAGVYAIQSQRALRPLDAKDGIDFWKHITRGRVQYRRLGEFDLNLSFTFGDELSTSVCVLPMRGTDDLLDVFNNGAYFGATTLYFNEGFVGAALVGTKGFSATGKGSNLYLTLSAETNVRFQIDHVDL